MRIQSLTVSSAFFFFCDAESSEKINRDVTGDLGDDKKGTKDQASPVVGVRGENVGYQRVSPISGQQWGRREGGGGERPLRLTWVTHDCDCVRAS